MTRVTLTEHYIELLMQRACFEEAPDGFYATVPDVPGLIAVGATAEGCAQNLRRLLEQWTLESLARNDDLPIVNPAFA